jgi:multimeric flavodoxin WrbA
MTQKRLLVLMGSPRKEGNSSTLALEAVRSAQENGAQVDCFHLHDMNIRPCRACEYCRQAGAPKQCSQDDDMRLLYPRLKAADALLISGPVYWFTIGAQTKLFMDRLYALGREEGYGLRGKRIGIILTYADEDPFRSGAVNALRAFQDSFHYVGAEIVGMVYGSGAKAGEIRSNTDLMAKAVHLGIQLICKQGDARVSPFACSSDGSPMQGMIDN